MYVFFNFLLLLILLSKFKFFNNFKELILYTALIFSAFIVLITETLSLFKSLNLISLASIWSLFAIVSIVLLIKDKKGTTEAITKIKKSIIEYIKSMIIYEKALFFIVVFGLLLLFFQGIIYPPNNWDSLTYHMSRIMFWLGNESLNHFPTHILRHLYQPPFTEYVILNINLLNGNDYLSNSVQWSFLVLSIVSIWAVLDYFEIQRRYKLLAAFLIITIPSVQLQASTTKNDIVCSFFIITVSYFCLKTYYELKLKNFIFLGISIGLALLTKGTAYIFLAPILFLFFVFTLYKLIKTKEYQIFLHGFLVVIIVILINLGHYSRNYKINSSILNIDETESKLFSNVNINGELVLSNLLKNVGLHIGYPFQKNYDSWLREIHKNNNINIDNPDSNYSGMRYQGPKENETNEDLIPNSTHFILITFCSIFLLLFSVFNPKKSSKELLVLFIVFLQIALFVGYLKWQPWHTRLHIPIFMLSVLIIILGLKHVKGLVYLIIACLPILVYQFYFNFVFNNLRPIIKNRNYTKNIKITDSRYKKYFSNQPFLYSEYSDILNLIYDSNPHKVGLMLSDWEYPIFHNYYYEKINLVALNVTNITSKIEQDTKNIDVIISNAPQTAFIIFEGKKYMNQTRKHSYIWLYK